MQRDMHYKKGQTLLKQTLLKVERNIMLIGTHRKAEAAPRGTASLLLQHMVDELKILYAKFY